MKKELLILLAASMITALTACGSSEEGSSEGAQSEKNQSEESQEEESQSESVHIYDDAEIVTTEPATMGSDKTWTYSIVEVPSNEVTEEALSDWYFNYCEPHEECDWNIILYTDKPDMGCFAQDDLIEKDTYITQNDQGAYVDDDKNDDIQATYYWAEDGELVIYVEAGEE